ncbi:MAG TPA: hypothetical protein VGS12_11040 [Caulobacteraceae bacterium]|nr:hypothetical protein [Caulobacteraceae bacterium]
MTETHGNAGEEAGGDGNAGPEAPRKRGARESVQGPPAAAARPLDAVLEKAQQAADDTAEAIRAQPYAAVIIATLGGLALGLMLGGGGARREVIYLKE